MSILYGMIIRLSTQLRIDSNQGMYVDYVYGALVERLEAYEQQVRQQTPQQQHADTSTLELALKANARN